MAEEGLLLQKYIANKNYCSEKYTIIHTLEMFEKMALGKIKTPDMEIIAKMDRSKNSISRPPATNKSKYYNKKWHYSESKIKKRAGRKQKVRLYASGKTKSMV